MSSPFPVLNNKPIDQWRVTELKEELKKRKLPLKGLKEELVRRLDESLREEMDQVEKEETPEEETTPPFRSHTGEEEEEEVVDNGCEEENTKIAPEGKTEVEITPEEKPASEITPEEKTETEFVAPEEKIDTEITPEEKTETQKEIPEEKTESQMITPEETTESKIGLEEKTESAELKPEAVLEENATYDEEKKPKNEQVSEQVQVGNGTGTGTGTQIKCESNSNTQSESISVKNDNLNTDNFDLEKQQVEVKQDEQGDQNKNKSASNDDDNNNNNNINNNINNNENNNNNDNENNNEKCEIANEGGSPEKLSLDRSSADDSMEEVNYEYAPDISSVVGVEGGNYENAPKVSDLMDEDKAPAEKRKLEAEETAQANENVKRQRRWNNDMVEVPERETPNLSQSDTPKDSISPSVNNKHAFNRSDSNLCTDSPKERIVPPSQNAATNSLRIDRFLRPFTLKAVQDLLGKTGTVSSFWMDHIKTHCYVTYSTVEEAEATRNAVYNLKWPSNGGNQLIAEFVDPTEVKTRLEAPPPVASTPKQPPQQQPPALSRQNSATRNAQPVREQQLPPPPAVRERLPPPPPLKKTDPTPAVVTLDDLFRKTKATPRIYYLPCSEEKVAAKLAARAKAAKE